MHRKAMLIGRIKQASDRYKEDGKNIPQLKGGGWLKKFIHKPLGSRDSGPRKVIRQAGNVIQKQVLPVALGIGGSIIGGPVGAVAGGAIGGSLRGGKAGVGRNMLRGALTGLGVGVALPVARNLMAGSSMGSGLPGLGNIFGGESGLSGLGNIFGGGKEGGAGLLKNLAGGDASGLYGIESGLSKLSGLAGANKLDKSGEDSEGSPLNKLLLGGSILGNLFSKSKVDPAEQRRYEQTMNPRNPMDGISIPKYTYMPVPNPNYGKTIDATKQIFYEPAFINHTMPGVQYAKGGYVHGGYIPGDAGGQDDTVDVEIPRGSFVADAETVSGYGDGNSENGKKKLEVLNDSFENSGIAPYTERIHVNLSPGEFVITPEAVTGLGGGNNARGGQRLEKMRKKLKTEKGFKKMSPPKAKSLQYYLR